MVYGPVRPEKIIRDFKTTTRWVEEGNPSGYEIQSIHVGTSLSNGRSYCEIIYVLKHKETPPCETQPPH